jgi:hypothetical protein
MFDRPGNLSGFRGMVPRNQRSLSNFSGSSKWDYEPPPAPPPDPTASPAQLKPLKLSPTITYQQDTRCPDGEKMTQVACTGADCDPGERENDCADDPRYETLMESIEEDDLPIVGKQTADENKLVAELEELEAEHEEVGQIVTQGPTMPLPSAYTGGGMPAPLPLRARKTVQTDEDKIAAMVSEHQTRQAMQRASAPTRVAVPMKSMAVAAPKAAAVAAAPPAPKPKKNIGDMFSWLKTALFGPAASFSGLGESRETTNILIPLIVGLGILMILRNRS